MRNSLINTTKEIVGRHIKIIRKQNKMTLQELADKIGADRQYVWNIENGEVNLSLDYLDKIIKALNASQNEFINTNF